MHYLCRASIAATLARVVGTPRLSPILTAMLLALHPLSFCGGPALGPPWVIDGDTGIHPSAAGYSQMAGQMPAPE